VELTLTAGAHGGHSATAPTGQNLLKLKEALWTFVDTSGVDPTHNAAERALRGPVIRRKLSFGTPSTRGTALANGYRRRWRPADNKVVLYWLICARPSRLFCSVAPPRLWSLYPIPN
jgi:hypothetical protein